MEAYITLDEANELDLCSKAKKKVRKQIEWDKEADVVRIPLLLIFEFVSIFDMWWLLLEMLDHGIEGVSWYDSWFFATRHNCFSDRRNDGKKEREECKRLLMTLKRKA